WTFRELMPEKNYKVIRRGFGKVTKSLGAARDLDTYIAFLLETRGIPEFMCFKPKIDSVILATKKERLRLKKLVSGSIKKIEKDLDPALLENRLKELVKKVTPLKKMRGLARKKISQRLKKLLSFREYAKYPHRYKKLHCLRIAAKHLRYTLENFDELYEGRLKPYIDKAHLLQDYLGDMHNYHVWGKLGRALAVKQASGSWVKLLEDRCTDLCRRSYDLFYREWKKQGRLETWQRLKQLIKR
ncbi:MAG: CHAD domain-containing protein, partial [Candidatus Omnitrophica bacterium]|nr:CHAD domain-containing protein [Candidatus Omnitrophota bacterium]